MSEINLTVIVPVFNCEEFITDTLESIFKQSYKRYKVIILDDCSSDSSVDKINEFIKDKEIFSLIKNNKNLGYLETTNRLFSLCDTEFIAFWDGDDICDSSRFEKQIKFLQKNKNISLVGSYCEIINKKGKKIRIVKYPKNIDIDNISICGSSILFRKEVLDSIGGYNPLFNRIGSEDFEWVGRAIISKFNYFCIPEALYSYRKYGESVSSVITDQSIVFSISHCLARELLTKYSSFNCDYLNNQELINYFNERKKYWINFEVKKNKFLSLKMMDNSILSRRFFPFYKGCFFYIRKNHTIMDFLILFKKNISFYYFIIRSCI